MRQSKGGGQRPGRVVPGQQPLPQCDQDKGDNCDYRKRRTKHTPILIDGAVVEQVESFKFLGVHITNKLTWSKHTKSVVKRECQNLFLLRRLKRFQILKRFYSCTIESMVSSLPGVATARPPTARHSRG
jgi:hypothetical protein